MVDMEETNIITSQTASGASNHPPFTAGDQQPTAPLLFWLLNKVL